MSPSVWKKMDYDWDALAFARRNRNARVSERISSRWWPVILWFRRTRIGRWWMARLRMRQGERVRRQFESLNWQSVTERIRLPALNSARSSTFMPSGRSVQLDLGGSK